MAYYLTFNRPYMAESPPKDLGEGVMVVRSMPKLLWLCSNYCFVLSGCLIIAGAFLKNKVLYTLNLVAVSASTYMGIGQNSKYRFVCSKMIYFPEAGQVLVFSDTPLITPAPSLYNLKDLNMVHMADDGSYHIDSDIPPPLNEELAYAENQSNNNTILLFRYLNPELKDKPEDKLTVEEKNQREIFHTLHINNDGLGKACGIEAVDRELLIAIVTGHQAEAKLMASKYL